MVEWQCKPGCNADCCGVVPIHKIICKMYEDKKQREVTELLPLDEDYIIPITSDMKCVFLSPESRCVIYEDRPDICREYGLSLDIPCPYVDNNGKLRRKVDVKRMQRAINHTIDNSMRILKRRFV